MDPAQTQAQAQHMAMILMPMILLAGIVFMVIMIIPALAHLHQGRPQRAALSARAHPGDRLAGRSLRHRLHDWRVTPTAAVYPPTHYPPAPYPPANYPPQNPPAA